MSLPSPSRATPVNNHLPDLPPLVINNGAMSKPSSINNGSPISLPASMQSSFEGDMASNNMSNFTQVTSSLLNVRFVF